ncbi:MAG TPA: PPC domain-containing DNA-binding protein [Acidobacteriaceae bacterium]|nr:PPC domain-containing DNA-binding protein [Acidobacteriaceae bacterium]
MKSLLVSVLVCISLAAYAQTPQYVAPADAGPHGSAPGMQVKQLSDANGQRDYAVIFRPGDEPYAGLTQFAEQHHIQSAHFTAIGGFSDARLAWFDLDKKMFRVIPVDQQVEVVSLVGDIALLDGKPQVHMHCVVAYPDGTTRGGHILGAHVSPLLEVFVTADPTPLIKKNDPARALNLIEPNAQP